jgi:hypothetical protein
MSGASIDDQLARRRVVTVILRLLVGPEGHLVHGEVVDLAGASRGRFLRWPDLTHLLERWLKTLPPDGGK